MTRGRYSGAPDSLRLGTSRSVEIEEAGLLADWGVNAGRPKSQVALVLFRAAALARGKWGPRHPVSAAIGTIYRVLVEWVLGIEIPWTTRIGPRLRVFHGQAIVINPRSVLGADVVLRQGVTVGNRRHDFDCPVILDGTELGAYAAVLGDVCVGPHAVIGAHTVVVKDVPEGAVVVGNPARVVKSR